MNDNTERDPRLYAIPDTHGHAKGEHKPYAEERPLPLTARMLFLWFYHACRRGYPRFLMVADHMNYLTFEDPAAVNLVRRALKLAQAGDLYGAAETANVDVGHAAAVSEGLRRGMRYSIGAEVDNDPRSRPDAQNIVDAMRPDAIIRSIHFVPITHPVHGENWPWPFDNPEYADLFEVVGTEALWETYVTTLVDVIERLPGHIVGHFYVPAIFGHWPDDAKLETYEDRVLEAAAARGMAIEFNTRFLYRDHPDDEKRRYLTANKRLLRKAKERGVGIAIGSDAHSPKDQGNAFETVLAVLDELEINEIVFPLGGLLRRVALRVVREPEPEPPPPEPVKIAARPVEAEPGVAEAPKPVRKARPAPKPARAAERPEPAAVPPAAPITEGPAPKRPSNGEAVPARDEEPVAAPHPVAARPAPAAEPKAKPKPSAQAPPIKAPPPAKSKPPLKAPVAKAKSAPAKAPARKAPASKAAVPKAAARNAASRKAPAAKAPAAKVPARKASAAKRTAKAPAKAGTAKHAPPKRSPKPAPKKTAAAKRPPKKAAPAKKSGAVKRTAPAKKSPPPKRAAARAPAKKAAPAKRPAAKKSAPARNAPARKATAAKKSTKKTATKRR